MTDRETVYFKGQMGPGTWREIWRGQNSVQWQGKIWARYLFRNGERSLSVFAPIPWAKFKENGEETKDYFPGWPNGHFMVWGSLVNFDPDVLIEQLGIADPSREPLVSKDSGPIGYLSDEFNRVGQSDD